MNDMTSRNPQPDVESSCIAGGVWGELEQQLPPTPPEEAILIVLQGTRPFGHIGGLGMYLIREGLIEVQLRGKFKAP
jgi:hypothetical protein